MPEVRQQFSIDTPSNQNTFLDMGSDSVATPVVSPITDADDSGDDSEPEGSSVSNVTQKELQDMRDTAGEIDGDSDYSGSAMDSTLGDEYDAWEHLEAGERPWAFYHLRNSECKKAEPPNSTRGTTPDDVKAALSVHEMIKAAGTQEDDHSAKNSIFEPFSPDEPMKGAVENPAQDNDGKASSSASMTNLDVAHVVHQSTSLPKGAASSLRTAQTDDENCAEGSLLTILNTSTDLSSAHPPPVQPELEKISKGLKRVRPEEITETNIGAPRPENAKKAKLDMDTSRNQVTNSAVLEPTSTPASPVVHSFLPGVSLDSAAFELSSYRKGPISWNRESGGSSIELYYGEGARTIATVDGSLSIVIDPTTLRGFTKEEIPGSRGNSIVTLLAKDSGDAPVSVVFDRAKGSKMDIGKIQLRSFIRWLRIVVPTLPLLEGGER